MGAKLQEETNFKFNFTLKFNRTTTIVLKKQNKDWNPLYCKRFFQITQFFFHSNSIKLKCFKVSSSPFAQFARLSTKA